MTTRMTSIPEVLLRLGCSLVAWMVVYTHCVWLATLRVIECDPASDELWRLLLGFAPVAIGFSFLLGAMNKLPEIARILRWLGLPMVVLIPVASLPVFSTLQTATFGPTPICGAEPALWHPWWAPLQLTTLFFVGFTIIRNWLSVKIQLNQ